MQHILVILLPLIISGCLGSKRTDHQRTSLENLVDERLGPENIIELNTSGTFALCQEKAGTPHARKHYRYIVVRVKDTAVIQHGTFAIGYVKWLDDDTIEVYSGTPKEDSPKKIIHVNSPVE